MIQKLQKWKEQNLDWKGILKIKLNFDTWKIKELFYFQKKYSEIF